MGPHLDQKLGYEEGGEHEDERARPELDLLPDVAEIYPVMGTDARRAPDGEGEARGHDCDHARDFEDVLAEDEDQIGQGERQTYLSRTIVADDRQEGAGNAGDDHPDDQSAAEGLEEGEQSAAQMELILRQQQAHEHGEEGDGGGVIEQALALNQAPETRRRPHVAEDAD